MITYIRLALLVLGLFALLGENFWVFNKGKDSVIKNVVAGVATTIKQQDQAATEAVQAATAATEIQDTIKHETAIRHEKLQASVQANPRTECVMSPDELKALQDAAKATSSNSAQK